MKRERQRMSARSERSRILEKTEGEKKTEEMEKGGDISRRQSGKE